METRDRDALICRNIIHFKKNERKKSAKQVANQRSIIYGSSVKTLGCAALGVPRLCQGCHNSGAQSKWTEDHRLKTL